MGARQKSEALERDKVEAAISALKGIPGLRVAAEGLVMIASILLAFWIDTWSDRRADVAAERYYLQLLVGDWPESSAVCMFTH